MWDYQSVACVASLEGHGGAVTSVKFHPELPVILTGCDAHPSPLRHSKTRSWCLVSSHASFRLIPRA